MLAQRPPWLDWLGQHPSLFVPLLILWFAILWVLISYVVAVMSGWAALSKRFRLKGSFDGQTWPVRSARMRFNVRYGNSLSVGAGDSGLYLSCLPIFRIGHPGLLIPWSEVSVLKGEKGLIFKRRELLLGREESIPLRISTSLLDTLRQSAGDAWPPESVAV